jgi:hypothetical protein
MPGADDAEILKLPLCQWAAEMRAGLSDGIDSFAAPQKQHWHAIGYDTTQLLFREFRFV